VHCDISIVKSTRCTISQINFILQQHSTIVENSENIDDLGGQGVAGKVYGLINLEETDRNKSDLVQNNIRRTVALCWWKTSVTLV
jgi:hypothetical protein